MNSIKNIAIGIILSSTLTAALSAEAASDGTLGATSSGQSTVTLTVADRVQISNVADIALGAYAGSGNLVGQAGYCVYRNGGDNYSVTLTTGDGSFQVTSATASESIAFTAKLDDDSDASDGAAATYNTAVTGLVGSSATDCGGSNNGSVEVTFAQAAMQAASSASDYTATMTILVQPI